MLGRKIGAVLVTLLVTCCAMPALASARCKTFKHRAKVEGSLFSEDLAYLNIQQWVCFNGKRITKVRDLEIEPQFVNIGDWTMHFNGPSPKPTEEYRVWKKRAHGSYYVRAGGNMVQVLPIVPDKTTYVWVSMRIYGNGNVNRDRHNG
jgi:hypothetical protein